MDPSEIMMMMSSESICSRSQHRFHMFITFVAFSSAFKDHKTFSITIIDVWQLLIFDGLDGELYYFRMQLTINVQQVQIVHRKLVQILPFKSIHQPHKNSAENESTKCINNRLISCFIWEEASCASHNGPSQSLCSS